MSLRCRNVNPADKEPCSTCWRSNSPRSDAPAGVVTLIFSGGAALRLEVECLECELADLGPTWDAKARPVHEVDSIRPQG